MIYYLRYRFVFLLSTVYKYFHFKSIINWFSIIIRLLLNSVFLVLYISELCIYIYILVCLACRLYILDVWIRFQFTVYYQRSLLGIYCTAASCISYQQLAHTCIIFPSSMLNAVAVEADQMSVFPKAASERKFFTPKTRFWLVSASLSRW